MAKDHKHIHHGPLPKGPSQYVDYGKEVTRIGDQILSWSMAASLGIVALTAAFISSFGGDESGAEAYKKALDNGSILQEIKPDKDGKQELFIYNREHNLICRTEYSEENLRHLESACRHGDLPALKSLLKLGAMNTADRVRLAELSQDFGAQAMPGYNAMARS